MKRSTLLLVVVATGHCLYSQQAIVNMPSADITPRRKHFYMHETQTRPQNPGRYWYGTNFYAYGVGKATELAVTSYNVGTPATPNFATGIGFKSAPQLFRKTREELEIKWTVGQMGVMNHRGKGFGSFTYSHLSMRTPGTKTRLTAGGFYGTEELFKRNTGNFLGSVEQPLFHHKIQVVAEWFRGQHDFGFFIPGVSFHLPKEQVIVVAYKFANNPKNGANGLVIEYGLTF
ncbi:MAG: hypothetical protein K7J46_04690 [Bryobacter sp.]|nr:hypothetical protein [Bryobacter sp. CoA8 C33]